ncbi:helical hairpin domain-containing protein, partial [Streptococcus anginosus]
EELKQLDNRLARLHKIEGALMTLEVAPENSFTAIQVLQELNIPTETELTDIQQRIQQYQIEKEALQEFFEDTLKQYTNYQEIKDTIRSREAATQKQSTNEKSLT